MSQSLAQPQQLLTVPRVLGLVVWAGMLYAALAIANLKSDWGHAICGAWGCGPPLQAIVGCHLAWCVLLGAVVLLVGRNSALPSRTKRWLGWSLVGVSIVGILAIVIFQRFTWWAEASEWQQQFFWHRCGFSVITATDIPLIQLFLCGLILQSRVFNEPLGSEESTA